MSDIEKKIIAAYVETIKSVGGRGPRNLHVKIKDDLAEIHFWLLKSPFEQFIVQQLEEGPELLKDIYEKIHQKVSGPAVIAISEQLGKPVYAERFDMDLQQDKFCFVIKLH